MLFTWESVRTFIKEVEIKFVFRELVFIEEIFNKGADIKFETRIVDAVNVLPTAIIGADKDFITLTVLAVRKSIV